MQSRAEGASSAQTVDGAVQTPVHFVEENIDPSHEWNEWKLRQDALKMCDILRKRTRGAQTAGSTFRREGETQTYLPKEATTNTGKEGNTQTPHWKRYMSGLRGEETTNLKVIDFKFEL